MKQRNWIITAVFAMMVIAAIGAWSYTHDVDVDFSIRSKAKWEGWPTDYSQMATVVIDWEGTTMRYSVMPGCTRYISASPSFFWFDTAVYDTVGHGWGP